MGNKINKKKDIFMPVDFLKGWRAYEGMGCVEIPANCFDVLINGQIFELKEILESGIYVFKRVKGQDFILDDVIRGEGQRENSFEKWIRLLYLNSFLSKELIEYFYEGDYDTIVIVVDDGSCKLVNDFLVEKKIIN